MKTSRLVLTFMFTGMLIFSTEGCDQSNLVSEQPEEVVIDQKLASEMWDSPEHQQLLAIQR